MSSDNTGDERRDDLTPEPERVELPDPMLPPPREEPPPPPPSRAPLSPPPTPAPGFVPPPPPPPGHAMVPSEKPPRGAGEKPGMVVLTSVLILVGGVWAVAQAIGMLIASACCWLPWMFALPVGIFAFIHGLMLLTNPRQAPMKAVPALMIVCILNCDVVTMTLGIIALVLLGTPEVRDYYEERGITY